MESTNGGTKAAAAAGGSGKSGSDFNAHDMVFIGNFVKDIIIWENSDDTVETRTAMGGSVTYGPLAVAEYGGKARVISSIGPDPEIESFLQCLQEKGVNLEGVQRKDQGKNTSYQLRYDKSRVRTLTLKEKGFPVSFNHVLRQLDQIPHSNTNNNEAEQKNSSPFALLFVPIAAELDEGMIIGVVQHLRQQQEQQHFVVGIDIQGYLRDFEGEVVTTRPAHKMQQKLQKLSDAAAVTFLKAEYGEALSILKAAGKAGEGTEEEESWSPAGCAEELQRRFGFPIVSVTMGPNGSWLCTEALGTVFVPTYKPDVVVDETGCGDTFLACTICELLHLREGKRHNEPFGQEVLEAVKVGSCAASFLVEDKGPKGFASRAKVLQRIAAGVTQGKEQKPKTLTRYTPSTRRRKQQQQTTENGQTESN
ncbi:PfkB domain-containing protein [Balamuthia mandrillaris]